MKTNRAHAKKSPRTTINPKLLAVPAVLVGMIVTGGGGYYVATARSQYIAQAKVAQTQTASLDAQYHAGLSVKRQSVLWHSRLSALAQELPPRRNQSALLLDITTAANNAGVILKNGSEQSAPAAASGVSTYSMSIRATGTYAQIQAFSLGLTSMPRLAAVQSETMNWNHNQVSANFVVDTFSAVSK